MDAADHWTLDPEIDFLNHGSFGACPRPVLARQDEIRARMEREPVRFFVHHLEGLLDDARQALADLLCCQPADLAFVPNATAAVNAVLRSFPLAPGDELLTTDHEYNACLNALQFAAERAGARVRVAQVPFPLASAEQVVEAVLAQVSGRTRLALLDHVTSQTGLVLPIAALVAELKRRGIETLVDGAHGVGQLDLDLPTLGAAWYTSNCHKWLCTPKGAAFLWTRPDLQAQTRPLAISHGANSPRTDRSRYLQEFDWQGTDDPSAVLCIPEALRFLSGLLPGGLPALRAHNRELAIYGREVLCLALGIHPPAPNEMIGALASVPLPDAAGPPPQSALYADPLQEALFAERIEVPVVPWPRPPRRLLRISAQFYNRRDQYVRLARVLGRLLAAEAPA